MALTFNPITGQFDVILDKADEIKYDNGTSGLAATEVQSALDEIVAESITPPGSSTDNALARFDGTTGQILKNSSLIGQNDGRLTLGADGTSSLDAVTKQQLDAAIDGVQRKNPVVAATTADITLSGEQTIDDIAVVTGDRVLVKTQSDQTENGIYLADSGAWTRTSDANSGAELNHAIVSVQSGTLNGDKAFEQTTDTPTVGVDNIVWIQAYGAGTYTADGQGIELTGATFSLELDGGTLSKSASGLRVAALGITDSEISNSAAITLSKLAALNASILPVTDASGFLISSVVTSTEAGYLSGVTSAIQTQIDNKVTKAVSSTDHAIARFDGATGGIIQNSGPTISDAGELDMTSQKITSLATPTAGTDAATKAYVDGVSGGYVVVTETSSFTADINTTYFVDTTGGPIGITLPPAVANGFVIIKDFAGNANNDEILIVSDDTETIDGQLIHTIDSNYGSVTLVSDGTDWAIL